MPPDSPRLTPFLHATLFSPPQPERVTQPLPPAPALESPGSARRAAQLRARVGPTSPRRRPSAGFAKAGLRLLISYWIVCLAVIAVGLDRLFPEVRAALATPVIEVPSPEPFAPEPAATFEPARLATAPDAPPQARRPFPTCGAAIRAGVYNIPAGSPAYTPDQDGDADGVACEVH